MPPPLGLPLLLLLAAPLCTATSNLAFDCADPHERDDEPCSKLIDQVETIADGSYYFAKVPCIDCPYTEHDKKKLDGSYPILEGDNDLLFNVSLSHNNRTLLLNGKPIFPSLATNPHPPYISTSQISPNFTYTNLATTLACDAERQLGQWCIAPYFSGAYLNYDYLSRSLKFDPEAKSKKWEIAFDAIGAQNMDTYSWSDLAGEKQRKLRITIVGQEVQSDGRSDNKNQQAGGGGLFDGLEEEEETLYDLTITSVDVVERETPWSPRASLSIWGRVRRFFGTDIVEPNNHIVFVGKEWGDYGKNGSLRNYFGIFIYDWPWDIVFIIVGSIIGGIIVIYGSYRFVLLVNRQRELARWDGMDAVWAQIRRERSDDEEDDALLDGPYLDDPGEGGSGSSRYRDDVATNKPLPSKPLPEKPLPEIPLIDA